MHDLVFVLSRSLKVEVNCAIRKPAYDFLLVNNSKHDLEFDLSISTKVKVNGIEFDLSMSLKIKVMVPLESPHMTSYQ